LLISDWKTDMKIETVVIIKGSHIERIRKEEFKPGVHTLHNPGGATDAGDDVSRRTGADAPGEAETGGGGGEDLTGGGDTVEPGQAKRRRSPK
jgi:hypothetical protein